MFDLALHYGKGPIPLRKVAERQLVSEHYLEQLMRALRQAGLVNSKRGSQGGYELADLPENIRIGDIIRVLEGPITPARLFRLQQRHGPLLRAAGTLCAAQLVEIAAG